MDNRITELRKLLDSAHALHQVQLNGLKVLKQERDGAREVNKQLRAELNTALNEVDRLNTRICELEAKAQLG